MAETTVTFPLLAAGAFTLAVLMEGLTYLLGARRPHVQQLDRKAADAKDVLAKERAKPKSDKKTLEIMQKQVTERQKELSQALMWAQLAPSMISLLMIPTVLRHLRGQVFGHLPFQVPWPLTFVVQAGLEDSDASAVSMNCVYFLLMAASRSLARRFYPQVTAPSPF